MPHSNVRISTSIQNGKLISQVFDDVATLYDCLRRGARIAKNGPFLGYRRPPIQKSTPYTWIGYDEVIRKCEMFGRGLVPKFCQPGQQTYVGIYAQNRPEWIIAEHACYAYSMVIVPIYNTAGLDSVKKVLSETELPIVVIDTMIKLELLIKNRDCFKKLKLIVVMDDIIPYITPDLIADARRMKLTILTMKDILKIGENNSQATASMPPEPSNLAIICYTSGTSGSSRGVLLSHANVVACFPSLVFLKTMMFTMDDVFFSYLPAAHCFERGIEQLVMSCGGSIGFFSGSVLLLGDDFFHLRPTKMPCVPSLINRVYNNSMAKINASKVAKCLFTKAFARKKKLLDMHIICDDTIWDYIVFKKIRNYFGGRLKAMVCGSAPISPEALTFMRIALGCVIVEGYGLTENTAVACTLEGDSEPGSDF
uniref:long-chain-fatty-acid--CoA ligase n=1 Tax=Romanomermis culicivorax TaxID=13658 RepID=A0A915I943_ROMCU